MPPPTTLVDLATDERTTAGQHIDDATLGLATAAEAVRAARDALHTHTAALAAARSDADAIRTELAGIATAGAGEALLEDLEGALVRARDARAGAHQARADLADATAARQEAAARLDAARQASAAADADVEWAEAEAALKDRWRALLADPALGTLADEASGLLGGPALADRRAALDAIIPEKLRQAALKRRDLVVLRRSHAHRLTAAARDLVDAAAQDPAAAESTRYARARDALGRWVATAGDRLATARAWVEAETPGTGEGVDEQLATPPGDAAATADLEVVLTEARIEVEEKAFLLRTAELGAVADPDQDPAVVTDAQDDLGDAEDARDAARTAFEGADPEALERWELAVPDDVWRDFARLQDVADDLSELAGIDPADLESELTDAEEALAAARARAAESRRRRRELEIRHAGLALRATRVDEQLDGRLLGAVQGEG
jgi:hypothetical protein